MFDDSSQCPVCHVSADLFGNHHVGCGGNRDRTLQHNSSTVKVIVSPIVPEAWEELQDHPDKVFCSYILFGIRHGFRVGFDYSKPCECATRNMQSAVAHPVVFDNYINEEVAESRIIGPLQPEWQWFIQISRFSVIPKPHQPGK